MEFQHTPVLLKETVEGLNIQPDGIYVDGTLGKGGHSLEIVKRLTTGRLIGIDQDECAIKKASETLSEYSDKVCFVKGNYRNIKKILKNLNIQQDVKATAVKLKRDIQLGERAQKTSDEDLADVFS